VEFVRVRDHVGWFPLHPRDRFIPWWERRDRRSINQNITYVNRTYVTVVNQNTFISARPVTKHIVRDAVVLREASSARMTSESLPIPSRSSLRIVSETGERRNQRPSANVLARAAVVRTAPPAPPPTFQEKLPEIQKSQGKPIAPSTAVALTSQNDKTRAPRVPIRPAAVEVRGGDFAPRTPGATSGPAPQPLTAARGKKLATRENPVDTSLFEKAKSAEKPSAQPQPLPPSPSEPNKGTAGRPESPRPEQDRDRQRQEKQTLERERQAQQQLQKQQELERKQQEQQKEAERKAQPQQKQQDQELRQQLRQQQLQDRQAQEQQKQQELERRQQGRQTEAERKAQLQQRQQEQIRLQQLRQQQLQERQGREPQIEQQRPELKSQPLPQQQQAK